MPLIVANCSLAVAKVKYSVYFHLSLIVLLIHTSLATNTIYTSAAGLFIISKQSVLNKHVLNNQLHCNHVLSIVILLFFMLTVVIIIMPKLTQRAINTFLVPTNLLFKNKLKCQFSVSSNNPKQTVDLKLKSVLIIYRTIHKHG